MARSTINESNGGPTIRLTSEIYKPRTLARTRQLSNRLERVAVSIVADTSGDRQARIAITSAACQITSPRRLTRHCHFHLHREDLVAASQSQTNSQAIVGPEVLFRNVPWGSSQEQIQKIEKTPLLKVREELLICKGKLGDDKCGIIYDLQNGELCSGGYVIPCDGVTSGLAKFRDVKAALIEKYGAASEYLRWKDTDRGASMSESKAIGMDFASKVASWQVGKTHIFLRQYNMSPFGSTKLSIYYSSAASTLAGTMQLDRVFKEKIG